MIYALFDIEMAHDAIISILVVPVDEWSDRSLRNMPPQ
jgi:hypothetical protein